jgi:methyltransferase (TIGR00027 family)
VADARPDNTAVRVALWRALHLEVDAVPPVLEDRVGLAIAAPEDGWRERPDMSPRFTAGFRASIVARARFIEDLVAEAAARGVTQYVILGAGLDTFAQRRADLGGRLQVFEVDQPGPQEWKRQRLAELGYQVPDWLHLVPFDFEDGDWHRQLAAAGFDPERPAVVASTGVSMYLTREANLATLRQLAGFAPGTTLVMSFLLPAALLAEEDREGLAVSQRGAAASGTPFRSLFAPREVMALAREAGFADVRHVCAADQNARYFAGRADGLRSSTGEDLLIATTGSPAGRSYALAPGCGAAKRLRGGLAHLGQRDVTEVLGHAPAMAEGISELAFALTPERVRQRAQNLRPAAQRSCPGGVHVIYLQVEDGGGTASRGRRHRLMLGELIGQHHHRGAEVHLDVQQPPVGEGDAALFLRAERIGVPARGGVRAGHNDVCREHGQRRYGRRGGRR